MIEVTVSKTRKGSNNLEFDVISGSNLEKIIVERYGTFSIKIKLEPGNRNDYISFCHDCFDENSNFIEEVEKEIIRIEKESEQSMYYDFKFNLNGFFMIYFQEGKNLIGYESMNRSAIGFRNIPV